ncbi:hypothetical protein VKT23_017418 [Stygiomarasmius scandens]|uniref:F-box domain-containing protein n=1 Tax=Marasmiellus scandens TaxID=2682957 RepID=A0ABR1ISJ6_9AGAR
MTEESPFAHLLNTNHSASPEEIRILNVLLSGPLETVSRLNFEIEGLERALDELRHERGTVQNYIDVHKALTSPIRQLSSELLAEIFVHCLPSDRNATRSLSDAPLLLGLVCRRWRDISLSTPRLWSSVHITTPYLFDAAILSSLATERIRGVETWLNRSGTVPLSISFYAPPSGNDLREEDPIYGIIVRMVQDLWRCIASHSGRWRSIELTLTPVSAQLLTEVEETLQNIPQLESFRLSVFPVVASRIYDQPFKANGILERASRLQSFAISGFTYDLRPSELTFEFAQLSHLELSSVSYPRALDILLRCRCLISCVLHIKLDLAQDSMIISPTILLPSLENLTISIHVYHDLNQIFNLRHTILDSIIAPALLLLDVSMSPGYLPGFPPNTIPVQSLLSRSSFIEDLRLDIHEIFLYPPSALKRCLDLLPNLKSFNIPLYCGTNGPEFYHFFISYLTPRLNSPIPCPNLRALFLRQVPGSISDDQVLDLVSFRRLAASTGAGIAMMDSLQIYFARRQKQSAHVDEILDNFRQEGMKISLIYYPSLDSDSAFDGLKHLAA